MGVVGGEQTRGDVDNLRGSQINRRLRCPSFRTAPRVESGNVLPFPRQPLPPSPSSLAVHAQDTVVALGLRLDCVGRGACLGRVCVCVGGGGMQRGAGGMQGEGACGAKGHQAEHSASIRMEPSSKMLLSGSSSRGDASPLPAHDHPSTQTTSTPPPRPRAPLHPDHEHPSHPQPGPSSHKR